MTVIAAIVLLGTPSHSVDLKTISRLIDQSLKGTEWRSNGWGGARNGSLVKGTFAYRDQLLGSADIRQYREPTFNEKMPPNQVIQLMSKEVLNSKGKDWEVWLLDFSDSERRSTDHKRVGTLVMLRFYHGMIGGQLSIKSLQERGFLEQDRKFAIATLTKTYGRLKAQFESGGK